METYLDSEVILPEIPLSLSLGSGFYIGTRQTIQSDRNELAWQIQ